MTRTTRFMAFALCTAMAGLASAQDKPISTSFDPEHRPIEESANAMHIVDAKNVTDYSDGSGWYEIADGVMQRETEHGYTRHVFGVAGMQWKVRTISENRNNLRAKDLFEAEDRLELARLDAEIEDLEDRLEHASSKREIGGDLPQLCFPDYTLDAVAGKEFFEVWGEYRIGADALAYNWSDECSAKVSGHFSIHRRDTTVANTSWQNEGTNTGEGHGHWIPTYVMGPCWSAYAVASYQDSKNKRLFFEVYDYDTTQFYCN